MKARATDLAGGPDRVHVRASTEQRAFRCEESASRWISTYEIREYVERTGARWVVHCRDGEPVPPPQFADGCPGCGRVSVTIDNDLQSPTTEPQVQTAAG